MPRSGRARQDSRACGSPRTLALLLHDPATGAPLVDCTSLPRVLAGAVVLQLVLDGRPPGAAPPHPPGPRRPAARRRRRPARRARPAPADTTPKRAVEKLHRHVRDPIMGRLVATGVLRVQERSVLGSCPLAPRWPAPTRAARDPARPPARGARRRRGPHARTRRALVALVRAVKAEHEAARRQPPGAAGAQQGDRRRRLGRRGGAQGDRRRPRRGDGHRGRGGDRRVVGLTQREQHAAPAGVAPVTSSPRRSRWRSPCTGARCRGACPRPARSPSRGPRTRCCSSRSRRRVRAEVDGVTVLDTTAARCSTRPGSPAALRARGGPARRPARAQRHHARTARSRATRPTTRCGSATGGHRRGVVLPRAAARTPRGSPGAPSLPPEAADRWLDEDDEVARAPARPLPPRRPAPHRPAHHRDHHRRRRRGGRGRRRPARRDGPGRPLLRRPRGARGDAGAQRQAHRLPLQGLRDVLLGAPRPTGACSPTRRGPTRSPPTSRGRSPGWCASPTTTSSWTPSPR